MIHFLFMLAPILVPIHAKCPEMVKESELQFLRNRNRLSTGQIPSEREKGPKKEEDCVDAAAVVLLLSSVSLTSQATNEEAKRVITFPAFRSRFVGDRKSGRKIMTPRRRRSITCERPNAKTVLSDRDCLI